ncbi:Hypothetical 1041 kDa protein in hypE 3'region [Reinekea sp. MED297]|uniref:Hypothetical 1041 kDa protein in hypE 3'region n=1 Tax=Reinekea blandensis MED297 TaxID=314283 RepID=A4BG44_9GAMM|nr:Hypothetical 1041 kDa protein in hypE 3'region [Reinekea sp. MED297] [Reinekea blandensis MED297]
MSFEASYRTLVDHFAKPVVIFDQHLRVSYTNIEFQSLFHRPITSLYELADTSELHQEGSVPEFIHRTGSWQGKVTATVADAKPYCLTLMPVGDPSEVNRYAGVLDCAINDAEPSPVSEVTPLSDMLTGLPDRYAFHHELTRRIENQSVEPDFAVLYIDLDHFKDINELYGHSVGDRLLCHCARQIRTILRKEDFLARVSGDEFAAIVSWEEHYEMHFLCQRLMRFFERPVAMDGEYYQFTLSIGLAFFPEQGQTPQDLLINSEKAMFRAKQQGRAQFQLFDRQQSIEVEQSQRLAESLRRELKQCPEHFSTAYQPLYSVQSGECVGLEVLARWKSPVHGVVPPSAFIPLAESRGLINALTARQFEIIRQDLANSKGHKLFIPIIAVNVAAQQISDPVFERMLLDFARDVRTSGWQLEVELTESQLMTQIDGLHERLQNWRRRGIRIAIDDFGTGYSCLAYLHSLPVDKLKIDRQFLQAQTESRKEDQIMYAIMSMANALGIEVLAEGVETAEQLTRLKQLGCAIGQGFGLAPPQPWRNDLLAPLMPGSVKSKESTLTS